MTLPVHSAVDRLTRGQREGIDSIVAEAVPSMAPAVALSVWRSGGCWLDLQAGWVDPETRTLPASAATRFDLASLTKLFTATAILRLASDGRVGLDSTVTSVVPEFAANSPRGVDGGQEPLTRHTIRVPKGRAEWTVDPAVVTFRQLLTHTSGMAPWRAVFRETGPVPTAPGQPDPATVEERWAVGLEAVFDYPFVARPGEESHYSDLGFMTLAEAVGRLTRTTFDEALRVLVLDRLALGSVTFSPARAGVRMEQIAPTSIDLDWRLRRCHGEVEDENAAGLGGVAGHAGLFATAEDVARFGVAWMRQDPRLRLNKMVWTEAIRDQTAGKGSSRGLGWQTQPTDHLAPFGPHAYGHTGFTGTSLAIDPDRDLVVALLTNRVYAGRSHEGIEDLRLELHRVLAKAFG